MATHDRSPGPGDVHAGGPRRARPVAHGDSALERLWHCSSRWARPRAHARAGRARRWSARCSCRRRPGHGDDPRRRPTWLAGPPQVRRLDRHLRPARGLHVFSSVWFRGAGGLLAASLSPARSSGSRALADRGGTPHVREPGVLRAAPQHEAMAFHRAAGGSPRSGPGRSCRATTIGPSSRTTGPSTSTSTASAGRRSGRHRPPEPRRHPRRRDGRVHGGLPRHRASAAKVARRRPDEGRGDDHPRTRSTTPTPTNGAAARLRQRRDRDRAAARSSPPAGPGQRPAALRRRHLLPVVLRARRGRDRQGHDRHGPVRRGVPLAWASDNDDTKVRHSSPSRTRT